MSSPEGAEDGALADGSGVTLGLPTSMPEISRFLGIVIAMFYNDHGPAHFHVRYGEQKALIAIESLAVLEGDLPPRVLGLVVEWARMHREELIENWANARELRPLRKVAPLE